MTEDQMNRARQEGFLKKFKLTTTLSTTNMRLLDANGVIKKYDTPEQIVEDFFHLRLDFYEKRRVRDGLRAEMMCVLDGLLLWLPDLKPLTTTSNLTLILVLFDLSLKN
ncbi:DNA topoisomerase 2 [Tanacetum coccineum]